MTEIYLIRHTQAEGNLFRAMQGHWDGDVTALGLQEIDALAERMRDVKIDALYASDLKRAVLTAGAIRRYHALPLRTEPELREINVGPWEARFFGDVGWAQPEMMDTFIHRAEEFFLDGAERYDDVRRRAAAALRKIAEENDGKVVAVVSHGVTIRCLLSYMLHKSLDDPSLPICGNTGICHVFYENGEFVPDKFTSDNKPYKRLFARAYVPKSDNSADFILSLESGIKKEVSVGCSVKKHICSICGKDIFSCSHSKGKYYSNKLCFAVLDEPTDAYEWSFVAVPAQKAAGVIKNFTPKGDNLLNIEKRLFTGEEQTFSADEVKELADMLFLFPKSVPLLLSILRKLSLLTSLMSLSTPLRKRLRIFFQ